MTTEQKLDKILANQAQMAASQQQLLAGQQQLLAGQAAAAVTLDLHTAKLDMIIADLGVGPDQPEDFQAETPRPAGQSTYTSPTTFARTSSGATVMRAQARFAPRRHPGQRDVGSPIIQPFSWDPPSDGGVTVGYQLDVTGPPGTASAQVPLGSYFELQMTDDTATYTANLTPLAADGTQGPPASTSFVPHVPGAPPGVPAQPTNFAAGTPRLA
jgi:hypothetical protein